MSGISRPSVSKEQAIPLAFKLFSLQVSNTSNVKELDSYEDRNFLLKGNFATTKAGTEGQGTDETQYVLKVLNPIASRRIGILSLTSKVLFFLNERGIQCPVPQLSVFGGNTVWCRFNRQIQGQTKEEFTNKVCPFKEKEIIDGVHLVLNDGSTVNHVEKVCNSLDCVDKNSDLCAIRLFRFIPGKLLCEVKWNPVLLYDLGVQIGNMHTVLKEFGQTSDFLNSQIEAHDNPWDVRNSPASIIENCHVIEEDSRRSLVQNIAQHFKKHIVPKLKQRDTQVIHSDLNEHNVIVEQREDGTMEIKGLIDFGEMHVSHRVLDVGVALAYTMMEALNHGMSAIEASNHVIRGYQTALSLSSLEKEMVFEASKICISHSLVMGTYNYKYVCPGNEYVLYTSKNGWNVLDQISQTPLTDIINAWKSA